MTVQYFTLSWLPLPQLRGTTEKKSFSHFVTDIKNHFSPLVAIFAFPMYLMSNLIGDAFLKYLYMKEESNWSNSRELTEFKKYISN